MLVYEISRLAYKVVNVRELVREAPAESRNDSRTGAVWGSIVQIVDGNRSTSIQHVRERVYLEM